ncbi:MAG: hypothetical protein ABFQ89_01310, partial [Chloroflexota bacterium]
ETSSDRRPVGGVYNPGNHGANSQDDDGEGNDGQQGIGPRTEEVFFQPLDRTYGSGRTGIDLC